jgi:hypothetical protein
MAAPTPTDLATEVGTLLKTVYGPAIVEQQNNAPMAYKMFKRSTKQFRGSSYQFPARMGSPQSFGMRPIRTALPTPLSSLDVTTEVRHKAFYATGDLTGIDIEKGKDNVGAFVNVQTDRMDALTRAALKDLNFQFYLGGDGVYATVTALPTDTTEVSVDTFKYLRVGRRIDVWDDSAGQILTAATTDNRAITAISYKVAAPAATAAPNVKFSVARNGGTAVGDRLIPETGLLATATGAGIFFNGLKSIVDDGSQFNVFQAINRTTYPGWKAKVLSNSGSARPLTLQLMQLADDIPSIMSGETVDLILGSPNARNLYQALLVSQKRFMNTNKLDGGYETLEFNGKKFVVDIDCQDDRLYFLNQASIEHFGLMDLKFDESDGAVLKHGGLASGDVYYFFLKAYANFGTSRCNSNAVVTDLEIDSNYLLAA